VYVAATAGSLDGGRLLPPVDSTRSCARMPMLLMRACNATRRGRVTDTVGVACRARVHPIVMALRAPTRHLASSNVAVVAIMIIMVAMVMPWPHRCCNSKLCAALCLAPLSWSLL